MNHHGTWITLLLAAALMVVGCREPEQTRSRPTPHVYTTFYPTTYFTQRIAGAKVKVVCPLDDGHDPISWMPPDQTIADYQQAELIVINGAGFEKWIAKVSLPPSKVVDTAAPLGAQLLRFDRAVTHSHGPSGEHSHEGVDGHTWLDPHNAKVQAEQIRKALARLLPGDAGEFQANFATLAADLDALDRALADLAKALGDTPLLASHPAYNYLARRYKWNIVSLDLDPRAMPDVDVLSEIRQKLNDHPAKILLWESAPTDEIAAKLGSELGLRSIVFSPCETLDAASVSAGQDYLTVMKANIARLAAAL